MKCLVTGGAGFIGSNLVDELIEQENEVIIIDNLSTGKKENINPQAKLYELDIRDLEKIKPLFEGVDYVFHLAAIVNVEMSIQNPIESNDVNLNGTLNILTAARDAKVKKVVFSSSAAVYGEPKTMPVTEDTPTDPMSPYGLQKYTGELYCKLFSEIYNLPTASLRYFNVYGERMPLSGAYCLVLGVFASQRLKNQPLTITGDGEQKRDFISVTDIAKANILAAKSENIKIGETINIGSGHNHSVNEIAEMIGGETTNIPPRIEPREILADNTLARTLLDWQPSVNLPEWIKKYKIDIGIK